MKALKLIATGLLAVAVASASQIVDTVKDSNGNPLSGFLYITWPSFISSGGQTISAGSLTYRVNSGVVSLILAPTQGGSLTNGSTAAPVYFVRLVSTAGGAQTSEMWSVPTSNIPLTISQVIVTSPTQGGGGTSSGGSALNANYSGWEVPAGTVDGVNQTFTLAHAPNSSWPIFLTLNGVTLRPNLDYVLSGQTITFQAGAAVPASGDVLQAAYWWGGGSTLNVNYSGWEVPAGTVDGVNQTFTLAHAPNSSWPIFLTLNGVILRPNLDYVLSGQTITFQAGAAVPASGDVLQAAYWY